jgi:D-alanyl-D-alanine carboxypeptidase
MSVAAGAGAIRSTARDLIVWHSALLGGKLLKPASLAMMLEPGRLKDGRLASVVRKGVKPGDPPSDYGFGITTGVRDGRRAIGHGGSINGFNAALTTYPDQAVTIVVLMNTTGASGTVTKPMTDAVFTALGYAALPKR